MAFPCMSVIVMSVLLNVAVMWAMPSASTTFLARFAPAVAFACAIKVGDAFGLDHLLGALRARRCLRLCHLLFQEGFLLPRDGAPRPLLGARVGMRALAAHRQILAVPRPAIGPDVHQSLDVHRDFGPERPFDLVVRLDPLPQPRDLGVAEIPHARVRADPGLGEDLARVPRSDAVDVRKSVQDFLIAWQVDARNACHGVLALPLLVLGTALADDADDPPPLDHLAMLADRFDAGANLQNTPSGEQIQLSLEL